MADKKQQNPTEQPRQLAAPTYFRHVGDTLWVDPDECYGAFINELKELGEFTIDVQISGLDGRGPTEKVTLKCDGPDQYWAGVCYSLMKMDTVFWCKLLRLPPFRERRIHGTKDGWKERWSHRYLKPGRMAAIQERFGVSPEGGAGHAGPLPQADQQVRREARQIYEKLRGVKPGMTMA